MSGGSDIDSRIDSAFNQNRFSAPGQSTGSTTSVSERVLESQRKFGEQFQARTNAQQAASVSNNNPADFGRFADDGPNPNLAPSNPMDDERVLENLGASKSQFVKHEETRGFSERDRDVQSRTKQAEYRPASYIGGSSGSNSRVLEDLEDLRVQNEEILRRLKRIEDKLRGQ